MVEANRVVANFRERNPLADPRIHIILNDARNALALTDKKYDAIVSQPSHPWTEGACRHGQTGVERPTEATRRCDTIEFGSLS